MIKLYHMLKSKSKKTMNFFIFAAIYYPINVGFQFLTMLFIFFN